MTEININTEDLVEANYTVIDLVDCIIVASIIEETDTHYILSPPVELRNTPTGVYAVPFNPYVEGPVQLVKTEVRSLGKASKIVVNHYKKWMSSVNDKEEFLKSITDGVEEDAEESVLEELKKAIKDSDKKLH